MRPYFYCDAILTGGTNDEGTFYASTDPQVIEKTRRLKASVEKFIQSARTRYETRISSAGTGSQADQDFDESYEAIIQRLDGLISSHGSDAKKLSSLMAAGSAKFHLADNHLFFEELLSGDDSVKFDDILQGLDIPKKEVVAMKVHMDSSDIDPILSNIDTFIASAKTRNANNATQSAAGSEVDETFDSEYDAFITLADEAESLIQDDMSANLATLQAHIRTSGIIITGIVIAAVTGAVFIGLIFSRLVGGAFNKCLNQANQISEGNLTQTIDVSTLPKDETGTLAGRCAQPYDREFKGLGRGHEIRG